MYKKNKLVWFVVDCRLFCGFEDIYCLFLGSLNNLCSLNKQYGLTKCSNEAMFVIEAYRTLRDRGPYPADQVVKDLDGSFAFVVYDSKAGTVFAALVINIFLLVISSMFLLACLNTIFISLKVFNSDFHKWS